MFYEYFDQSKNVEPVPMATVVNAPIVSINTSVSTTIAQDAPSTNENSRICKLEVLGFVPRPIYGMVIALKWIYKGKLDEYGDVLEKTKLVSCKRVIVGRKMDVKNLLFLTMVDLHEEVFSVQPEGEQCYCPLTDYADADPCGMSDSMEENKQSRSAQFLGDSLVSGHQRSKEARPISTTEAEYIACLRC
ncbi:hypothetical protein Tco_1102697 [Tanacetum coccineum]